MGIHEISLEYKHRTLSKPMLQQIVGANQQYGGDEIIVRCLRATKDAKEAAETFTKQGLRVTIIEGETPPAQS